MTLTRREQQVCERLRLGETDGQIAAFLGLRESTIGAYLTVIFRKLNVGNRVLCAVIFDRMQNHRTNVSRRQPGKVANSTR